MGTKMQHKETIKSNEGLMLYIAMIVLIILFAILKPSFFSFDNLNSVLQSMSCLAVLGVGATMILTIGEIDISNGAMMSVAPCFIAVLILYGVPTLLAVLIGFVIVIALGFLNGVLVASVGIPSFIATLGVQGVAMGLSRTLTNNKPVIMDSKVIIALFGGKIGDFSVIIFWMIGLVVLGWFLMYKTKFGRYLHAIGDNKEAAAMFGIKINKYKIIAFIVVASFVFFAGMMESLRSSYVRAGFGESQMLFSIVVALIGGTSVQGGKSSIGRMFVGAAFVTIVSNGLFQMALSSYMQNIIVGIIIIIVLSINAVMENKDTELKRM